MRRFNKSLLVYLILVPLGLIGGFFLDFVIAGMIYPDPCIYHFRPEPKNVFFTLFFDYDASTGYHPEPSFLSMVFYAFTGALVGIILGRFILRYKKIRTID